MMMRKLFVTAMVVTGIAVTCEARAQFPNLDDLEDRDPTGTIGSVRGGLRDLDRERLHHQTNRPRLGKDYFKIYIRNDSNVPLRVVVRYLGLGNWHGGSELAAEGLSNWTNSGWYDLQPKQTTHVASTNNKIFYFYATGGGAEWKGSHQVGLAGGQTVPMQEQRIYFVEKPREWTLSLTGNIQPPRPQVSLARQSVPSIGGTYNSNYGTVVIRQSGNQVSGTVYYRSGATGSFHGTISGRTLPIRWRNNGTGETGTGTLQISGDSRYLNGGFRGSAGNQGTWNLSRR